MAAFAYPKEGGFIYSSADLNKVFSSRVVGGRVDPVAFPTETLNATTKSNGSLAYVVLRETPKRNYLENGAIKAKKFLFLLSKAAPSPFTDTSTLRYFDGKTTFFLFREVQGPFRYGLQKAWCALGWHTVMDVVLVGPKSPDLPSFLGADVPPALFTEGVALFEILSVSDHERIQDPMLRRSDRFLTKVQLELGPLVTGTGRKLTPKERKLAALQQEVVTSLAEDQGLPPRVPIPDENLNLMEFGDEKEEKKMKEKYHREAQHVKKHVEQQTEQHAEGQAQEQAQEQTPEQKPEQAQHAQEQKPEQAQHAQEQKVKQEQQVEHQQAHQQQVEEEEDLMTFEDDEEDHQQQQAKEEEEEDLMTFSDHDSPMLGAR